MFTRHSSLIPFTFPLLLIFLELFILVVRKAVEMATPMETKEGTVSRAPFWLFFGCHQLNYRICQQETVAV